MSLNKRKPVSMGYDQVRLKLSCFISHADVSDIETSGTIYLFLAYYRERPFDFHGGGGGGGDFPKKIPGPNFQEKNVQDMKSSTIYIPLYLFANTCKKTVRIVLQMK